MLLCAAAFARSPVPDPVALRDRVLPLVEEVAGRRFTSPPPVVVLRSDRFDAVLASEAAALELVFHPDTSVERLRAYGMAATPMAPAVAGKYALFEGTIYLVPDGLENATRSLRGRGFEVEPEALAECVLAHELVHALQHDTFEQVLQGRDREAANALNMVTEGHATWVHEQVCGRLGHPELVAPMRVLLGIDGDPPTAYAVGLAFVERDPSRIWSVLAEPPVDTLGVWFPDRSPLAASDPAVDGRLRAATSLLGSPTASVVVDRIGYDALFREHGGTERAASALDGFRGGRQAAATDGRATVLARRITFSSPESAAAYVTHVGQGCADLSVAQVPSAWPVYLEPDLGGAGRCHLTVRPSNLPIALEVDVRAVSAGAEVHVITLVQAERREELVQAALAALAGL